jgi:L-fuconolactonase
VIIDAHQHFWKYNPVRDSWINDEMKLIQKDFLPADLKKIFDTYDISGSVVVQSDQSEDENKFQIEQAAGNDFIKGIVGWLDLQADDLEEKLIYYEFDGKVKGLRHVLQGEPDRALMLKPAFKRGIGMLSNFRLTYDILIYPDQLEYAKDLVAEFPDQQFVIDHLAKPEVKKGNIKEWAKDIKAIAAHENVYCKISGMVTEADWKSWKPQDFTPYIDVVVEAFGINRIMYGSDWPVCLVAADYEQVLNIVQQYFLNFTSEEREKFFSANAIKFYQLKSSTWTSN